MYRATLDEGAWMIFHKTAGTNARPHRWIYRIAGGVAGLLGLAGILLIGATYKPSWYRPAVVTSEDCRAIRNELPSFGSAIGAYLAQGQPFRIELTEEHVNRWIAARDEIWPAARRMLPAEIQDPVISFQPGQVIVGARCLKDGMSSIVSLATTLGVANSGGALMIRVEGFYAGLVPVPRMLVEPAARKALARAIRSNWRHLARYTQVGDLNVADELHIGPEQVVSYLKGRDLTQTSLPSRWIWPNGKFPFCITDVQIEEGRLLIDITPMPRQVALSDILSRSEK